MAKGRRITHIFVNGIESKQCSICGESRPINEYYRSKITSDGLRSNCRDCECNANAAAYAKDPVYAKNRLLQWAQENPERMKEIERERRLSDERKAWVKEWQKANPDKVKMYHKRQNAKYTESGYWAESSKKKRQGPNREKYLAITRRTTEKIRSTPKGIIDHRMSLALRMSLHGGKARRKWTSLVGYTTTDLIARLSETMPDGYSWDQINGLHIDHIVPKSLFRYESVDDPQFKACWGLDNLQLLPAIDNIKKSNRITENKDEGGLLWLHQQRLATGNLGRFMFCGPTDSPDRVSMI